MYKLILIEVGETFSEKLLFSCHSSLPVWNMYIKKMHNNDYSPSLKGVYVTDKAGNFIDPPPWVWEDLKGRA